MERNLMDSLASTHLATLRYETLVFSLEQFKQSFVFNFGETIRILCLMVIFMGSAMIA